MNKIKTIKKIKLNFNNIFNIQIKIKKYYFIKKF